MGIIPKPLKKKQKMKAFLKTFRKNHNLTQKQLAVLLNVSQNKISDYENGKVELDEAIKNKFLILKDIEKEMGVMEFCSCEKKTYPILFRCDEKVYKIIKHNSKLANLSINQYLARTYDGGSVVVIEGLKEFMREINRIGTNLNQITTLCQLGKIRVADLESTRQGFIDIITKLNRIVH